MLGNLERTLGKCADVWWNPPRRALIREAIAWGIGVRSCNHTSRTRPLGLFKLP